MGRPKLTCEVGDVFNMFEVIDSTPIVKKGHTFVKTRCTYCGYEQEKALSDLKRGNTSGCSNCKGERKKIKINIGDRFGEYTVLSNGILGIHKNSVVYECQCSCGNKAYVSSYDLRTGKSTRCKHCSAKRTGEKLAIKNGKIGDLTMNRFYKIKKSAEVRNIEFNVELKYLWNLFINQNQCCAITGDYIQSIDNASLDRINSNLGYVEGNVQWVTKQANISKHIMSMEELLIFCQKVINHANQQPSTPLTKCEGSETNS
jgi:hypothetical protein